MSKTTLRLPETSSDPNHGLFHSMYVNPYGGYIVKKPDSSFRCINSFQHVSCPLQSSPFVMQKMRGVAYNPLGHPGRRLFLRLAFIIALSP
jgi:hypothetical protein